MVVATVNKLDKALLCAKLSVGPQFQPCDPANDVIGHLPLLTLITTRRQFIIRGFGTLCL
jgi:hypothetical protein